MRTSFASFLFALLAVSLYAQNKIRPVTLQISDAAMKRWPEGHFGEKAGAAAWGFEPGIVLAGMDAVWQATRDPRYFTYIKRALDQWVQPDGSIQTYDADAYSLNNILLGRELLLLERETGEKKYRVAAETLYKQLVMQPRTASGGMWHAKATPNLMLLDDEFMLAPFYAEYARMFNRSADLDDVTKQFVLLYLNARDPRTGLMYHGWDESRKAAWANKQSGTSPNKWARGMGWYLMGLVDTLQYLDEKDVHRAALLDIFRSASAAVERATDVNSSLWYQLLDKPTLHGNNIESSSALMFTYAFQKGVRLGYLPHRYHADAERAWRAIQRRFVKEDAVGNPVLTGTVTHIAMGATAENDGSDAYYLGAPIVSDDPKGIGAFLLAGSEMELRSNQ